MNRNEASVREDDLPAHKHSWHFHVPYVNVTECVCVYNSQLQVYPCRQPVLFCKLVEEFCNNDLTALQSTIMLRGCHVHG